MAVSEKSVTFNNGRVIDINFGGKVPAGLCKDMPQQQAVSILELYNWQETHHVGPRSGRHTVFYVRVTKSAVPTSKSDALHSKR